MRKTLRVVSVLGGLFVIAIAVVYDQYHRHYPYGHRTCALPCSLNALKGFALSHEGWYPRAGSNGLEALTAFAHEDDDFKRFAAGLSGNEDLADSQLGKKIILTQEACSWIYYPGFRIDDPRVCIIWERTEGIDGVGRRSSGHAVGYSDGMIEQVALTNWSSFQFEQTALREEILKKRGSGRRE